MDYSVPILSIVFMAVVAMLGIVIPVVLLLVFRKKYKTNILAFFIGCAVFIVFALIIEAILHRLILSSAIGLKIQGNIWLFAVYGGLMAGIFEETGRFTVFKTLLRKKSGNDGYALMYGAGHGGFEAFYLLTVSMISYISMAVMLNAGMSGTVTAGVTDEMARKTLEATFTFLANTPPASFLMSIVERMAAVALHISLSVLVWFAAKDKGRFWLYPLAVILHAVVDAAVIIMARNGLNVWIIEAVLYVMTACCIIVARIVWKKSVSEQVNHSIINEAGV
ncbi:MAG TPA: YhfC family glutamic-type intramembrane protease [Anaerovoracaceae bacterium]|nr:YhfC family glutamic-type intramembrane protease [Anaerovoracaceae bacterium]HYE68333.1 YhfC family glutamic-type intramembrane protease [Anaerovoracaceae bacterium]